MMEIELSVRLLTGRLSKGNQTWQMEVGFQGNRSRQLFFLRVRESAVDAGTFLESLAGETAGEYLKGCRLESSGLICSHQDQGEIDLSSGDFFPDDPGLSGTLSELLRERLEYVDKGVCLWMVGNLKNISVFSGILKIGYQGDESLVILGCLVKAGSSWNQFYYAKLPKIQLFQAVTFQQVRLLYQIIEEKSALALSGKVELSMETFHLGFQGEIRIDQTGYRAAMSALEDSDTPVFSLGSGGACGWTI